MSDVFVEAAKTAVSEYYKCDICHMFHRKGFSFARDSMGASTEVNGQTVLIPPAQWVWSTPPEN